MSRLPWIAALVIATGLAFSFGTGTERSAAPPTPPPFADTSDWVEAQLDALTLEQKVAQLFSVWVSGYYQSTDDPDYRELTALVEDVQVGGLIFGSGDPMEQAVLTNDLQRRADLPLLVAQDMEWGAGMRINRTTTLPPAMAIGATRNPAFARMAGYVTAREARALGVQHVYAPVADVNNNPANPIINIRSFGERAGLVAEMTAAFVDGTQRGGAMATAKHFPGHGDTSTDSHLDLPVLPIDRARLDTLELVPFRAALDAGVASIMTGHLALPALDADSIPATLSPAITDSLLRQEMGFDGLVVTDALNMQGVTDSFGVGEAAVRALEAGADVLLMSTDPRWARAAILEAVNNGRLTEARIDRSVRRILEAKAQMGLPEQRTVDLQAVAERVSIQPHQVLRDAIARASTTLLRDATDLLPITPRNPKRALVVTLSDSDDPDVGDRFIGELRGTPAFERIAVRRLDADADEDDIDAVLNDVNYVDVVLVASFLRVRAWSNQIGLSDHYRDFLTRLMEDDTDVALVSFGNPYATLDLERAPDAYLAAYGSHDASQTAAAQAIRGASAVGGQLPVTLPEQHTFGTGLERAQVAPRVDVPEAVGMNSRTLARTDSLLHQSMLNRAFPGAAVAVGRQQTIAKLGGTGYYTYDAKRRVTARSIYDVASLTKVIATTTAAMQLYEAGELALDAPVTRYLPAFGQNGKSDVTIRQLLSHSSGLEAYLGASERGSTPQAIVDTILAEPLQYDPGAQSEYSGLGMITLMRVIETISGQDFDAYCEEHIFDPLGMTRTGFRPARWTDTTRVVPTTDTTGTHLQGTVHDPIARRMDGVSGNAGLFSTAEDLARFAYMLVNDGRIYGRQFLQPETIDRFTRRAGVPNSTRALGWDTKSTDGYSSAGQHFGPRSFGHTGYTGTSMWIDPERDLFALLLTNRVYPDDTNRTIIDVRPAFADLVFESIVGPPEPLLPEVPAQPPTSAQ